MEHGRRDGHPIPRRSDSEPPDLAEKLLAARDGDALAAKYVYKHTAARVFGFARYWCTGDAPEPEDVCQEVFLRAFCPLKTTYHPRPGCVRAWLIKIAKYVVKEKRPPSRTPQAIQRLVDHRPPVTTPSPGDEVDPAHDVVVLAKVLESGLRLLDARERRVILDAERGVPLEVTAGELGVSEGRVSQLRRMARLRLVRYIAREHARVYQRHQYYFDGVRRRYCHDGPDVSRA